MYIFLCPSLRVAEFLQQQCGRARPEKEQNGGAWVHIHAKRMGTSIWEGGLQHHGKMSRFDHRASHRTSLHFSLNPQQDVSLPRSAAVSHFPSALGMSAAVVARQDPAVEMHAAKAALASRAQSPPLPSSPPPSAFTASPISPGLMALVLPRAQRFDLLASCCRSHLSTHLECGQSWYLLALSLLAAHRFDECFAAVRECLQRHPADVPALLLAGQVCMERLGKHKEAVEYASRALRAVKAQIASLQSTSSSSAHPATGASGVPQAMPTSLATLQASPVAAASSTSSSFSSLWCRSPQVLHSLLISSQLLFGQACGKYAYHVSTFSNRKSLQKRAIHAMEQAVYQQSTQQQQQQQYQTQQQKKQAQTARHSSIPSSMPIATGAHRKLLFSLACLYADTREIPRALALLKRCLFLERSCGPSWNLLALLLSAQKKYASAAKACMQGLAQLAGGSSILSNDANSLPSSSFPSHSDALEASVHDDGPNQGGFLVRAVVPLLLTQAKVLSHMNQLEAAIATFNELVRITFPKGTATFKQVQRAGAGGQRLCTTSVCTAAKRPTTTAAAVATAAVGSGYQSIAEFRNLRMDGGTCAHFVGIGAGVRRSIRATVSTRYSGPRYSRRGTSGAG